MDIAVFVYNTCVPVVTGDDVGAICKDAAARAQIVNLGSLKGLAHETGRRSTDRH
ncbi:hypothetical protein [Acidihalobacter yilgarnensis]|uniref:hypothetical protein n=1 Tax=Acidihalobacter yilgarnensis TaxID=2819280 RepID=UPI0012EA5622|nr:hypothetical protein [Acidihalobacter yilgarnensis]